MTQTPSHQLHPLLDPETPDLRIIPTGLLVEHEFNDVQRTEPLARRLQAEGILKNPPIVTPVDEGDPPAAGRDPRYVVLDGANRVTSLHLLKYPHCLAQVVRYEPPQVTLSTWHHLVTNIEPDTFSRELDAIDGLDFKEIDLLHARAGLARRDFIAYVVRTDGKVFAAAVSKGQATIRGKNALLNAMVNTYKERGGLFRATTDNVEDARRLYPSLTGLVIFPNYEPSEVMALARDGELLPAGLTRHLIQGRALRINFPLSELKSGAPLEEKNAKLAEWMRNKMAKKEVRYYAEATYLFDE
ncbi:MAG: hypothetical protein FJ030_10135 [Chloroflexi bacterium]|nr:hypothetical protein [Chloroflexota bacterium]